MAYQISSKKQQHGIKYKFGTKITDPCASIKHNIINMQFKRKFLQDAFLPVSDLNCYTCTLMDKIKQKKTLFLNLISDDS